MSAGKRERKNGKDIEINRERHQEENFIYLARKITAFWKFDTISYFLYLFSFIKNSWIHLHKIIFEQNSTLDPLN